MHLCKVPSRSRTYCPSPAKHRSSSQRTAHCLRGENKYSANDPRSMGHPKATPPALIDLVHRTPPPPDVLELTCFLCSDEIPCPTLCPLDGVMMRRGVLDLIGLLLPALGPEVAMRLRAVSKQATPDGGAQCACRAGGSGTAEEAAAEDVGRRARGRREVEGSDGGLADGGEAPVATSASFCGIAFDAAFSFFGLAIVVRRIAH